MKCSMPASLASSTTYWISGLSTMVSISFGIALVAGRTRVPRPATGKTALRIFMGRFFFDRFFLSRFSWRCRGAFRSMWNIAACSGVGSRFAGRNKGGFTSGPGIENHATKNRFVKRLETSTRPPESGMFRHGADGHDGIDDENGENANRRGHGDGGAVAERRGARAVFRRRTVQHLR